MHPVRNVSSLKAAGQHRPTPREADESAERLPAGHAVVRALHEHTDSDKSRWLRVRVSLGGRVGRGTVLAATAIARAGFAAVAEFAATAPSLPNYLGREVSKQFAVPGTDGDDMVMRPFRGLVVAFDPADVDQQFQVAYEDGDREWLPLSGLEPLLTATAGARAALLILMEVNEE